MSKTQILWKGTPEQQQQHFHAATLDIDALAAKTKAEADQFGKWAQEKRKAGFPEQAVNFEKAQEKLLCKWTAFKDALRIIAKHVE